MYVSQNSVIFIVNMTMKYETLVARHNATVVVVEFPVEVLIIFISLLWQL